MKRMEVGDGEERENCFGLRGVWQIFKAGIKV